MRNLNLKNVVTISFIFFFGICNGQDIESIISYRLVTKTIYNIDECTYQNVGELNPIYWIDKQHETVETEVTEVHYDDCTIETEVIYVNEENYFPQWIETKPYKVIINNGYTTSYDEAGNIISSIPRSEESLETQLQSCNTYFLKYLQAPTFPDIWNEALMSQNFVKVIIDACNYKYISDNVTIDVNDCDYSITTSIYEAGELIHQNTSVNTTINNGGTTVLSSTTSMDLLTNKDNIKYQKIVSKDYANQEVIHFNPSQPRSIKEELSKEISITPNPASESISISQKVDKESQLRIVDSQGKKVYENSYFYGHDQVSISHLISGIYFVQISNMNEIITEKLIIK